MKAGEWSIRPTKSISLDAGTSKLSTELDGKCPLSELNAQVIGLFVGHVSV